jgi:hypothetical protein
VIPFIVMPPYQCSSDGKTIYPSLYLSSCALSTVRLGAMDETLMKTCRALSQTVSTLSLRIQRQMISTAQVQFTTDNFVVLDTGQKAQQTHARPCCVSSVKEDYTLLTRCIGKHHAHNSPAERHNERDGEFASFPHFRSSNDGYE